MKKENTKSPKPPTTKAKKKMTFMEALEEVLKGKSITKLEWKNRDTYGLLKYERLQLHKGKDFYDWIISEGDMRGDDWTIV